MFVSQELLVEIVKELKAIGKKVVFTNGCFDIVHTGHISYLNESKKLGDILIVALNTDDSVKKLKGELRPINNQHDRAIVVDALKSVDYVCLFSEDTPFNIIANIIPDVLTKGGDYVAEDIVGYDIVTQNNGQVIVINFVDGKSTTSIINKMK
ncbi:MAG TPA: D-glycero-beta-D-manno-heptose 1-phosphate adenylyltransferase [Candidatus Kapabacteria bacterium]|nr:D-glycero-beta-D-manno-heptose 1-phosphate adenylyltransferase [Candidatus Kapabacteria bacterium]